MPSGCPQHALSMPSTTKDQARDKQGAGKEEAENKPLPPYTCKRSIGRMIDFISPARYSQVPVQIQCTSSVTPM